MKIKHLLGLALLGCCLSAQAEVHRCKDAAGKTYFSDRGCPNGEKMRGAPDGGAHAIGTKSDDEAIAQRCLDEYRRKAGYAKGGNDGLRVASHNIKWVSVRDVGARRLLSIQIALLNSGPIDQHDCLLRGDNVTFQTTPYELVN